MGGGGGGIAARGQRGREGWESCSHTRPSPPPPFSWSSGNHHCSASYSCQHWSCQNGRHHAEVTSTLPSLSDSMCTLPQFKEETERKGDSPENCLPPEALFIMQNSCRSLPVTSTAVRTAATLNHPFPNPMPAAVICSSGQSLAQDEVRIMSNSKLPPPPPLPSHAGVKIKDGGTSLPPLPSHPPPPPPPGEVKMRDCGTSPLPLGGGAASTSFSRGVSAQTIAHESVSTQTDPQSAHTIHQPWSKTDLGKEKNTSLVPHVVATGVGVTLDHPITSHLPVGGEAMISSFLSARGREDKVEYPLQGDHPVMEEKEEEEGRRDEDDISVLLNQGCGGADILKMVHEAREQRRRRSTSLSSVDTSEEELLEELFFVQYPSEQKK